MSQRAFRAAMRASVFLAGLVAITLALGGDGGASAQTPTPAGQDLPYRLYAPRLSRDQPAPLQPTPTAPPAVTSFEIIFFDVGQGDATLITVNGQRLLIDGGRSASTMRQRLQSRGIADIDAVVMTHPDADHIGGLAEVLDMYQVERIYLNGGSSDSQTFANFMLAVNSEGATVTTLSRGQAIPLGGLSLPVLHPAALSGDSNVDSLVVRLTCGSVDVLLTGDAEAPSETSMLTAGVVTDVDVLKVGHHGSNTSSSLAFLQAADPEVAVISAGRTNQYGHPHREVLGRLTSVGASLVYTDTSAADDSVVMTSDCQTYSFSVSPTVPGTNTPKPTRTPTATPTRTATPIRSATPPFSDCSPAYPTLCLPPAPPDLDCGDIAVKNFPVLAPDPHRLDGNGDGVGCED